jgi:2-polyprenyl-3-methyl-5-hydroxy-6-metoxy-1,4-benzoquinol methylase
VARGKCRFCATALTQTFVDLGVSPLSNYYPNRDQLTERVPFYPLHTYICSNCLLVQLEEFETPEQIFRDYAYFSSYSDSWLEHCRAYSTQMIERFGLNSGSQVVEVASNDGYLLKFFKQRGIPIQGVEPARNVAKVAREAGIPTMEEFFGVETAMELIAEEKKADLLVANNVFAHVPDINDFTKGLKLSLKSGGVITIEVPYLMRLIAENQFDTIYHEHFSYYSVLVAEKIFAAHGLTLFDVQELPTHGGSLRLFARHSDDQTKPVSESVRKMRAAEIAAGYDKVEGFSGFARKVYETKFKLLEFLIKAKRENKKVVGYGAPAKGNTLLNFCGIRTDFLDYTVDRNPHKQGSFLPGSCIPVYAPERIRETKPDYVLILPWNLKNEIVAQMSYIREWGGQFVVPIPQVQVLS